MKTSKNLRKRALLKEAKELSASVNKNIHVSQKAILKEVSVVRRNHSQ